MKPVIAVDIDEVLTPMAIHLINWHNLQYGTTLTLSNFHNYDFVKVWGGTYDEALIKGDEFFHSGVLDSVSPIEDAQHVLSRLKKDNQLVIVTSRSLKHQTRTLSWINKYFGNLFTDVILCNQWSKSGPAIRKSSACMNLNVNYLIDDLHYHVEEVVNHGITGLLFGNYPWNRQEINHEKIFRVSNWKAIGDYFNCW